MSDGALFSTDQVATESRYQWHLWVADVLDLGTSVLVGWAALRALELDRTPASMLLAIVLAWLLTSAVGGVTGRTFWRQVAGVKLVRAGRRPGLLRGLARGVTTPLDLLLNGVLLRRPLDALLGLHAEPVDAGAGPRLQGVALQLPWLVVLAGAVWLLVTPTRAEMLQYLGRTLTGWHCCHGTREVTWQCRTSLDRAVRNARGGNAEAQKLVADCPVAGARLKP
ncbi:hypothetical protein [Comamonas sp. JC664]|uniref:hypothetical protein n=1 Tax=Comamonas sp. JC664 TaxID=2801917 RepID=UPI00192013F5|nr:hypothetical protein [Comamonas sp. JC664]MBL0698641.1 hypothetical protein [Comamonas sp. JC664]GHG78301.1 hypothetical protein GCM10012319_28670 [Comamonas sp. KCTC 72670]